jgi:DNA-binding MarR family transcriptional regulator
MNNKFRDLIRLTNNIYRCTQVYLDKKLEKLNLTTGSYPYLLVLNNNQGISQNEISRELNVDKAMSARIVKKLIDYGYIRKEENENDIRAYKLYLTNKGKEVIPEIIEIIQEWTDMLIEGNAEEQIENSLEFLGKVLENAKEMKKSYCERMKTIE